MTTRREMLSQKLGIYYKREKENSMISTQERDIVRDLWTKQLEVTEHFVRGDFVASVETQRTGILGKFVIFIKRLFRKGTYYIFKQFGERVYAFQSRCMELTGQLIQCFTDLRDKQMGQAQQLSELQKHVKEQSKAFLRLQNQMKEQAEQNIDFLPSQRPWQEALQQMDAIKSKFTDQIHFQEEKTVMLDKRLDEYSRQLQTLQSALLLRSTDDIESKQAAVLYAYRYLLRREPENIRLILDNQRDWRQLISDIEGSLEYKGMYCTGDFFSVTVEGITYFYPRSDQMIPVSMIDSGLNWAKTDIDNFIKLSDQIFYKGTPPQTGLFLDIGGNIGTTSIYCRLKIKEKLKFIAFEPVDVCAKLLAANAAMNGVGSDIQVVQVALSDQIRGNTSMIINPLNWGGCELNFDESDKGSDGPTDEAENEIVSTTTLDEYISRQKIDPNDIKYIWLDVEGHEYEVLRGAAAFFAKNKVPMCMEFNQGKYKGNSHYEDMLELLIQTFEYFFVASKIDEKNTAPRPTAELPLLWEEMNHETCDLILM